MADQSSGTDSSFSGGEQQGFAVARPLVQTPDILLLDEPTRGLASVIVEEAMTVLLTEQHIQFALALADRTSLIEKGANVWEGSVAEHRQRENILEEHLSVSTTADSDD